MAKNLKKTSLSSKKVRSFSAFSAYRYHLTVEKHEITQKWYLFEENPFADTGRVLNCIHNTNRPSAIKQLPLVKREKFTNSTIIVDKLPLK